MVPQRAVWWQITRLGVAALGRHLSQSCRVTGEFLYATCRLVVDCDQFCVFDLAGSP